MEPLPALGVYAPAEGSPTGVDRYARLLNAALGNRGRVLPGDRGTVALYHLANNPLHAEAYRQSLRRPGIVLLHDALLQHFFLATCSESGYVDEFVFNYGNWGRELARELYRGQSRSGLRREYYDYPLLRRPLEHARAVLVHNRAAAEAARRHAPDARIVEIPHLGLCPAEPEPVDVLRFRDRLKIPLNAFVFSIFGYLRESKRPLAAIRALPPGAILLLAGDPVSRDLPGSLGALASVPGLRRTGFLGDGDFRLAAAATDVCINLRDPSAGETSGIAIQLMGMGRPVMVSEGAEVEGFPPGACPRIPRGVLEEETLRAVMLWLASHRNDARRMGAAARAHIALQHAPDRVADAIWSVAASLA